MIQYDVLIQTALPVSWVISPETIPFQYAEYPRMYANDARAPSSGEIKFNLLAMREQPDYGEEHTPRNCI